jgi:hypothetical protein
MQIFRTHFNGFFKVFSLIILKHEDVEREINIIRTCWKCPLSLQENTCWKITSPLLFGFVTSTIFVGILYQSLLQCWLCRFLANQLCLFRLCYNFQFFRGNSLGAYVKCFSEIKEEIETIFSVIHCIVTAFCEVCQ